MSTIPLRFEDPLPAYTAVGGREAESKTGLSAVLLSRGNRLPRRTVFDLLSKEGFDTIVSIEGPAERYDIEELARDFPCARFVLLRQAANVGEQIDIAAQEVSGAFFFVLWNDLRIIHSGGAKRMLPLLVTEKGSPARLCTVPVIKNTRFESLPTIMAPSFQKQGLLTTAEIAEKDGQPSLYPFDSVGIYERERFFKTGGFDPLITSPYWQMMDFGLRAWLWGEEIACTQFVSLTQEGESEAACATADESYRRFYLKNLAPIVRSSALGVLETILPFSRFFPYFIKSGRNIFDAAYKFKEIRSWVTKNSRRFKMDASAFARAHLFESFDESATFNE